MFPLGWLQKASTPVDFNTLDPFKMLRDFLRRCWVYSSRVSFLSFFLTPSHCLPCFSFPVMFPGDVLADIGEHRPSF